MGPSEDVDVDVQLCSGGRQAKMPRPQADEVLNPPAPTEKYTPQVPDNPLQDNTGGYWCVEVGVVPLVPFPSTLLKQLVNNPNRSEVQTIGDFNVKVGKCALTSDTLPELRH